MSILGTLHVNAGHALRKVDQERLMEEFSVRFNGRHYEFGQYRFGRLAEAIDSARRSRAAPPPLWSAQPSHTSPEPAQLLPTGPSERTRHSQGRLRFALFRPNKRPTQ
jgi:hypothetical protein